MPWKRLTATQHVLVLDGGDSYARLIAVRGPYLNEPDGTKYVVTGSGHDASIHTTLAEAKAAAEASCGDA